MSKGRCIVCGRRLAGQPHRLRADGDWCAGGRPLLDLSTETAAVIRAALDEHAAHLFHELEMESQMFWHQALWGVPVGPTLTMVTGFKFTGIQTS